MIEPISLEELREHGRRAKRAREFGDWSKPSRDVKKTEINAARTTVLELRADSSSKVR